MIDMSFDGRLEMVVRVMLYTPSRWIFALAFNPSLAYAVGERSGSPGFLHIR